MNQLNVSLQHSIATLAANGWSARKIARQLGGAPGTCPDRSWCRTTSPGTQRRGDTGRQHSRARLREDPGKEGLEENDVKQPEVEKDARSGWGAPPLARASSLHSVALRAINPPKILSTEKPGGLITPLDNPHRGSGVLLGVFTLIL